MKQNHSLDLMSSPLLCKDSMTGCDQYFNYQ